MYKTTIPGNLQPGEQAQEFTIPNRRQFCADLAQKAFVECGVSAEILIAAASPRGYGILNDPLVDMLSIVNRSLPNRDSLKNPQLEAYSPYRVGDSIILDIDNAQQFGRVDSFVDGGKSWVLEGIIAGEKPIEDSTAVIKAVAHWSWKLGYNKLYNHGYHQDKLLSALAADLRKANCKDVEGTIVLVKKECC